MKYLDTNVLVRLITNDLPELAQRAIAMIEQTAPEELTLLDAVVTELCFVLEFNPNYRLPRAVIRAGLRALLDSNSHVITGEYTTQALDIYVAHPTLDYVDCLLLTTAGKKSTDILTFDKALLRQAGR